MEIKTSWHNNQKHSMPIGNQGRDGMHIPALICATSGQISNETHQATAILHSLCVVGAGGGGVAGSVIIQTSTTTAYM